MNIANRRNQRVLIVTPVVIFLLAMVPTDGLAANKSPKANNANARGQSQRGSANRGLPGTRTRTQDANGKIKIPGRIEWPNVIGARRNDNVLREPKGQDHSNVISSVGVKYTMLRRGRGADTTARTNGASSATNKVSTNADKLGSKNEVLIETLELASRQNPRGFFLPEVEDEVLVIGQPINPHGRMTNNQLRTRR